MRELGTEEFELRADEFNTAVAATPAIAAYCSGSDWILSAHQHLHRGCRLLAYEKDGHWVTLAAGDFYSLPNALMPVEAAWCFSCSLVGPNPRKSFQLLQEVLNKNRLNFEHVILGGVPMFSILHGLIRSGLRKYRLQWSFPGIDCWQASLEGGLEGFLSRRSAHFRAALKSSIGKADKAGLGFRYHRAGPEGDSLFARMLEVEKRSWKHKAGESVFQLQDHRKFYHAVFQRAAADGRLRVVFGQTADGIDIAYVAGGILGKTYRGFQMGYDDSYAAYGLGNLAQLKMIEGLSTEGIQLYDLGMAIDYKKRWSDHLLRLTNFIIVL